MSFYEVEAMFTQTDPLLPSSEIEFICQQLGMEVCLLGKALNIIAQLTFALDVWRRQRKFFHQSQLQCTLSAPETGFVYEQVINEEVAKLVGNLEASPEDWSRIVEAYICAIVVRLAYGRKVYHYKYPYVQQIIDQYDNFENAARPDYYLVNVFPVLRHLPSWLAPFKNSGQDYLNSEHKYLLSALTEVRSNMDAAEASTTKSDIGWSIAKGYWQNKAKWDEDDLSLDEAAYTLGAFVGASMAGTPPTLKSFFLAMLHYPEWQKRLQEEIDAVVNESGRLSCWTQKDKIPVTRAVVKEVLRWRPTLPSGTYTLVSTGSEKRNTADCVYQASLTS